MQTDTLPKFNQYNQILSNEFSVSVKYRLISVEF